MNISSVWSIVVGIINSRQLGEYVTRKEILNEVYKEYCNPKIRDLNNIRPGASEATIDTYRGNLTRVGFLSTIDSPGIYKLIKYIPEDLTSSDVLKMIENEKKL